MKGTILKCVSKIVVENHGSEIWSKCLETSGFDTNHVFMMRDDVDDNDTVKLLVNTAKILGITIQQFFDIFGDYWVNSYSVNLYKSYFDEYSSSKEFLLNLNTIHKEMTEIFPNAKPPSFDFESISDNKLRVKYKSKRGLIDIFISISKGLAKYYNDKVEVKKIDNEFVEFTYL